MMNWFQSFMAGRNGIDALSIAIAILSVAINVLARFLDSSLLSLTASAVMLIALFRIFSRNLAKRRAENGRFLAFWGDAKSGFAGWRSRRAQTREYRFFVCPGCRNRLRVPRGKGNIQITCPKCGQRFSGKS
jgi:LSD1 subclass zinc finger protein